MKKILSNFADSLISRDQMSKVKGGCGTCNLEVDQGYGPCGSSSVFTDVAGVSGANLILSQMSNVTGWRFWCV